MKKIILIFLLATLSFALSIEEAKELFDKKQKYKEAIEIFKQYPNNGEAQYYMGKVYLYGIGVNKNATKSYDYAKKSADQNNPNGLNLLGILYQDGIGVEKDELEALFYYKMAAKLGSWKATSNLANLYKNGNRVVKRDLNKSIQYYKKLIDYKQYKAYADIAEIYYYDFKDYINALKYYLNFDKYYNDSYIQNRIGNLYEKNNKDELAYKYYIKAIKTNNKDFYAISDLAKLERKYKNKFNTTIGIDLLKEFVFVEHNQEAMNHLYFYYGVKELTKNRLIKLYNIGYQRAGCRLSIEYQNINNSDFDFKKSYQIATNIINKNKQSKEISQCYINLANLYQQGYYVAKDLNKTLDLKNIVYKINPNYVNAEDIAHTYIYKIKDYENAKKWYKKAYELSKDKKYLTIVDDYIKKLPKFNDNNISTKEQKLYPIIGNFDNKNQVTSTLESSKYYFIATSLKDIRMYDKNNLKLLKTFRGWIGTGVDGITIQMAYDEIHQLLYATGINSTADLLKNDIIKVFDIQNGKIINTIYNKNSYLSQYLEISKDGKWLVSINQQNNMLNIINTKTNIIQFYHFNNREIFTKAKIIQDKNDYIIKVLTKDNKLYSFSVKKARQIKVESFNNQIKFRTFNYKHTQNILKNKISNGNKNKILKEIYNQFNLNLSNLKSKNKNLTKLNVKLLKYNRIIEVYKKDKLLFDIDTLQKSIKILNYKIIDDKYIVILFSDMTISGIYNLEGRQIVKFVTNNIQKKILYKDNRLVTYGDDNILNIWEISNLEQYKLKDNQYDMDIVKSFSKMFSGNILDIFTDKLDTDTLVYMSKSMNLNYITTENQIKYFFKLLLLKKYSIYPIASLYIKDNEWILYNHKGYFAASKNGKDLIKYHLNQGLYKEAKIIENKQLFDKFYRPDLIKKILNGEKVDFDIDIKVVIQNTKPPKLSILKSKLIDDKNLDLTYQICDMGSGISNTNLIINDIAINPHNTRGFIIEPMKQKENKCKIYKNTITLNNGNNTIAIKSYDKDKLISVTSKEIAVQTTYKSSKKVNLHLVTLAVSNYRDSSLNLKYAVSDVKAIEDKIKLKSKKLFKHIYTYRVHDKNLSKRNLSKIFDNISNKIDVNDVFILYIAGHGITSIKDGLYYLLPYNITDTSANGLQKYAISINDIKDQLSKIVSNKSLILLDTCESGGAIKDFATRGLEQRMALERLSYATGRNYIVASSKNQAALEGYKNHGVFTYSVLEAFSKAYFGDDTTLSVSALASYIENNVPKITNEKFHYEQFPQKYLNGTDFPIGMK